MRILLTKGSFREIAGVPFTLNSQRPVIAGNSPAKILHILAVFP